MTKLGLSPTIVKVPPLQISIFHYIGTELDITQTLLVLATFIVTERTKEVRKESLICCFLTNQLNIWQLDRMRQSCRYKNYNSKIIYKLPRIWSSYLQQERCL